MSETEKGKVDDCAHTGRHSVTLCVFLCEEADRDLAKCNVSMLTVLSGVDWL